VQGAGEPNDGKHLSPRQNGLMSTGRFVVFTLDAVTYRSRLSSAASESESSERVP